MLPIAPAAAQQNRAKGGGGKASASKARATPQARPASMGTAKSMPNKKPAGRPQSKAPTSTYSKNNVSNKQAYNAGKKAGQYNNQRDVVVVNNSGNRYPSGGGYYNNGRYYDSDWDDDDDDFLEFVGKTAAVTAGVAAVTAVIGSVVNDKPDDPGCTETVSNGVPYVNCNGTWYQALPNSSNYQVVPPPTR